MARIRYTGSRGTYTAELLAAPGDTTPADAPRSVRVGCPAMTSLDALDGEPCAACGDLLAPDDLRDDGTCGCDDRDITSDHDDYRQNHAHGGWGEPLC